jgi:hypothetical protein
MNKTFYTHTPAHKRVAWKRSKREPGEITLLTHNSQQYVLTSIGCDIFERCDGRTTIGEILEYLKQKYPGKNSLEIEQNTRKFLYALEVIGVLVLDWDPF